LVNTWRAIEVVADDLESVLDLTLSGDVQNVGSNPLALRSSTGRLRAGLAWDAPITRLQERNNYRQVLIQYQQAKRSYYQYEDSIWTSMRSTLRQLRQNQLSFEIQRFAVQNAALQISVNEDIRQINETLGQVSGPTAARDAVQGLQAFLNTQSQLIGVYVNYEAVRRGLDLDLGTMELDSEGLWIDPGPIRVDTVGGVLGDAIMEYGLSENEILLRDQIQIMDEQPIEIAPSDKLPATTPPSESPGNPIPAVDGPAAADPSNGASSRNKSKAVKPVAYNGSGRVKANWASYRRSSSETTPQNSTGNAAELPGTEASSNPFTRFINRFKKSGNE